MKKIIILSTIALIMGSCGIYSKYKPAKEVPNHLYGNTPATADTSNLGNLSWRDVFTDQYVQTLIDSALAHNTDMRTAHLRVKEAEAALLMAKLSYAPSIGLSPQGAISSFGGQNATKTYSVPVTASWEIDVFGRLTNTKRKAKALLEESKEYEQAVKTQLVAAVANNYFTLLMLDSQLDITTATETAWAESVRASRTMKKAGMLTEAGLAQTEATYYNACTRVLDLKEQINQAENSLCLLLAEVPHKIPRGNLETQQLPENLSVGIPIQMLSNRPDVKRAEYSLEQAFYTTNTARSAFYPQIVLGGNAGWTNSAGGMIINPGKFLISAVASLTQPLFNRGANLAQLKIAKSQQEQASLRFRQTLLNAGSEVNNALEQYQTAKNKAEFYDKQVNALQSAAKSTSLLMKHGDTTYLEVLTAQQTLLNAQLAKASNNFMQIQGIITLYHALGGGRM
ncbi:MAG: TolC family protein [Bacteroidales bacterium]